MPHVRHLALFALFAAIVPLGSIAGAAALQNTIAARAQERYDAAMQKAAEQYEQAVERATGQYRDSLELAQRSAMRSGDVEQVEEIKGALEALAARAAAAGPPRDYSSNQRGFAGGRGVDNTYTFRMDNHQQAALGFDVAGASGNDANGDVTLIRPDGSEVRVFSWTADQGLPVVPAGLGNFKNVEPGDSARTFRVNITEHIAAAGEYKVRFDHRHGRHGIVIYKVAIRGE